MAPSRIKLYCTSATSEPDTSSAPLSNRSHGDVWLSRQTRLCFQEWHKLLLCFCSCCWKCSASTCTRLATRRRLSSGTVKIINVRNPFFSFLFFGKILYLVLRSKELQLQLCNDYTKKIHRSFCLCKDFHRHNFLHNPKPNPNHHNLPPDPNPNLNPIIIATLKTRSFSLNTLLKLWSGAARMC